MRSGKTDLDLRPNTLKENKRVLCELRRRSKIDFKSLDETNRLVAKYNAKNALGWSKNARASLGQKQENKAEKLYGAVDGFPPGSWWGIRMDCSRDGVHEPFNQDLREGPFGVVSLCTSHSNAINDVDLGDCLTFTGGEYRSEPGSVQSLLKNYQNRLPLRLIRSYNLSNDYAPKTGYRYDGLYSVVACWIGVTSEAEKHYKFALARLPYQAPPSWQLSRKSTSLGPSNARVQDTRRGVGRLSDGSQNSLNDEDTTRNIRSRSLMTKCPLPKLNSPSQESTIVTRCISKKSDGQSCGNRAMVTLARTETLAPNGNRLLHNDSTSKSPMCKFQNTNISIRTDLYDSSNIVTQEPRKTIPMTFCRTYKNSRLPGRPTNHSNVVTLNLNSCGPCPRDNVQGSLIQSRSGIPKYTTGQSPSFDHVNEQITPKSSSIDNTGLRTNLNDKRAESPPIEEANAETILGITNERTQQNLAEQKLIDMEENTEKMSEVSLNSAMVIADKEDRNNEKVCKSDGIESLDNMETPSSNAEESTAEEVEAMKESQTDLDSLTPDEMLKFIVKQKCHPRAKLLIGSVIGLATGESTILRAYESLMSRNNLWPHHDNTAIGEKNEVKSLQVKEDNLSSLDDNDGQNCAGKERNGKDRTVSKSLQTKRAPRESKDRLMRKRTLRRTRVSKRLMMGTEKKLSSSNLRQKNVASQRLRKSNLTDVKKSQQPFSKSTVAKKSKKCAKKRRGELANLVIDAKIGPLIRGPRNRRLRCKTHIFAKKLHAPNSETRSSCCAKKPNGIGSNGKKEIGELSTRKSKVSGLKSQIAESRFAATNKRTHDNESNCSGGRGQSRGNVVNASELDATMTRSVRGEKRKLSRNRQQIIDGSIKVLCRDSRDNSEIVRVKMIDAATQCSTTRRDVTTSVDREVIEKPLNSIKIEWIDVDDVKSEISEDDANRRSIHEDTLNFQEDCRVSSIIGNSAATSSRPDESPFQRSSAFVPVNISDRDFRIARLRSIGFKPIRPDGIFGDEMQRFVDMPDNDDDSPTTSTENSFETAAVASREVDELFNKYTSEETTTVGYMDHELRYQDIEDEETSKIRARKNRNNYGSTRRGGRVAKIRNCTSDQSKTTRDLVASSNEADSEVPWHGWKKFVKNKQAQWIGW